MKEKQDFNRNRDAPKALIIAGHPRSGTTLLNRICNSHPDIIMTFEFRNFKGLNSTYHKYVKFLRKDWYRRRLINIGHSKSKLKKRVESAIFLARYLIGLQRHRQKLISITIVTDILHSIFPSASIVGDKKPTYIFNLDKLARIEGLNRLVIYRDCRDVVRSAIEKAQTGWRKKTFSTATKAAWCWVKAIEIMERHADKIHTIRYEDLVSNTRPVLHDLGTWLGINPAGFRHRMIHTTSMGKYKHSLSDKQIEDIMKIAGPTMKRLGYDI